jgi:hypothetical protein
METPLTAYPKHCPSDEKFRELALTSFDWMIARDLLIILQPFAEALDQLQSVTYPTISLIPSFVVSWKAHLNNVFIPKPATTDWRCKLIDRLNVLLECR